MISSYYRPERVDSFVLRRDRQTAFAVPEHRLEEPPRAVADFFSNRTIISDTIVVETVIYEGF